jgi:hypothetical protein
MGEKRAHKYWICEACAKKKRWKLRQEFGNTVIRGLCGHCKSTEEVWLVPKVDFNQNGRVGTHSSLKKNNAP